MPYGGVSVQAKDKFNDIQQELAKLATKFSNNVLDATKAWKKLVTTKEEIAGLPASALALTAQQAKAAGALRQFGIVDVIPVR